MSNVIQLLERLGQDASLQEPTDLNAVIAEADLNEELKQALLTKNTVSLEKQLDVCPDIVCVQIPAEDEEDDEDKEEEGTENTVTLVI